MLDGILAKEGESRQSLGRERYLERMREFVATTREVMLAQQRRVGASADWGRLRYTMDDGSAKAVRVAFTRLYEADLAYRTEALVNWCPGCRTSVSDLEVVATPETGHALVGPLPPHRPGDRRAGPGRRRSRSPRPGRRRSSATPRSPSTRTTRATRALVGRLVRIPFVERDVPIIADDVVDPAFGTGAVKITPAHDHDDHETGLRHGLAGADDPRRRRRPSPAPARATTGWTGSRRARRSWPTSRRAATSSASRPHEMVIGRCQRSNDIIEPRLKTQWFIRTGPLAARALDGDPRRPDPHPARALREDLGALADRHPRLERLAPAVVGPPHPGLVLPGRPRDGVGRADGPDACAVCGRPAAELQQDPDIFDTWFSSGLWPFSTLGWPDDTADSRPTTRPRSWRPATTSSSSGSPG